MALPVDDDEHEQVLEVARKKQGAELFRELLRHYQGADVEDYYKAGVWKNDKLKADIVLIHAHRMEAGAPDPLPLEEVPVQNFPTAAPQWTYPSPSVVAAKGIGGMPGALTPAPQQSAAAQAMANNALQELRVMALFVAKWKLDPVLTKQRIAKLVPERRRQVFSGFTSEHVNGGPEVAEDLEAYIKKLEETQPLAESTESTPAGGVKASILPPAISTTASAEARLLTLFVAKYKLDQARTKALLYSVAPNRRTQIINTFQTKAEGAEAFSKLEEFIKEATGTGVKRPISAVGS